MYVATRNWKLFELFTFMKLMLNPKLFQLKLLKGSEFSLPWD